MRGYKFFSIPLILSVLMISACGGGGSSSPSADAGADDGASNPIAGFNGETSAATASTDNQEALSIAAVEASKRAVNFDNIEAPLLGKPQADTLSIENKVMSDVLLAVDSVELPVGGTGAVVAENCDAGGSFTVDFPGISENSTQIPNMGTGEIRYNNCRFDFFDDSVINGVIIFSWDGVDQNNPEIFRNITLTYDVTVSGGVAGGSFSGTIECTNFSQTCDYSENYVADGVGYRIENANVSGSSFSGFNVEARVFDENQGFVDFSATNITFCENGNIGSGTIVVVDSTGSQVITIDFPNCSEFVVVFDGVATTFNQ